MSSSREHLRAVLQLALTPGVGPKTYQSLIESFGSAEAAAAAAPSKLRQVPGVGPKLMRAIIETRATFDVDNALDLCASEQVAVLTIDGPEYPRPLREIHSPPAAMFVRGGIQA